MVDVVGGGSWVVWGESKGASDDGFVEGVWVEDGSEGVGHNCLTPVERTLGKDEGGNMGVVVCQGRASGLGQGARLGKARSGLGKMKTKGESVPNREGESFFEGGELYGKNGVV